MSDAAGNGAMATGPFGDNPVDATVFQRDGEKGLTSFWFKRYDGAPDEMAQVILHQHGDELPEVEYVCHVEGPPTDTAGFYRMSDTDLFAHVLASVDAGRSGVNLR